MKRSWDDIRTSSALLRALAGLENDAAWTTFLDRYAPLIRAQCRKAGLQACDAEEACSRVLFKLVRTMPKFSYDPAKGFRGYLRTVVRSVLARYYRELARPGAVGAGRVHGNNSGDDEDEDGEDLADWVGFPAPLEELGEALEEDLTARLRLAERVIERVRSQVEPETWRVYRLTALEDREAKEAALELGKTVGAVYMAKHRVAKLLIEQGRIEMSRHAAKREETR